MYATHVDLSYRICSQVTMYRVQMTPVMIESKLRSIRMEFLDLDNKS